MAIMAGLFAYGEHRATSAIFSDLTHYGIEYGGDAYREIVATTEWHTQLVCVPLAVALIVSLVAWGVQILRDVHAIRTTSAAELRD